MGTATIKPLVGWATWQDGHVHSGGIEHTKRDLLIGYDLIPLRGLKETERVLIGKGMRIAKTIASVSDNPAHEYTATIKGRLLLEFFAWTMCSPRRANVARSLAHFLEAQRRHWLSEAEIDLLRRYHYFDIKSYQEPTLAADKRRQRTLDRLAAQVDDVFARLRCDIVRVHFEQVTK